MTLARTKKTTNFPPMAPLVHRVPPFPESLCAIPLSSPLVLKPDVAPKNAKLALDAFAYAKPEPISGDWGNVGNEIAKAMGPVYEGKATAKDALTAITGTVESLLAKVPDAPKG